MERPVSVTLPGGWLSEGVRWTEASLRPLSGADEAFLAETAAAMPAARRTTTLLARCLGGLGPLEAPGQDAVRELIVGDREALLLHLRRITFGDRLACVLTCPFCLETLDVDLTIPDLLRPPYLRRPPRHEVRVGARRVRFRLPTGADQEAAAETADPKEGAALMLTRCVDGVLPPGAATAVAAAMERLDPQAETRLSCSCPMCGASFEATLDAAEALFEECAGRGDGLFREVHTLALNYHWGEAEILAMAPGRRHRYLDLLAEAGAAR